MNYLEKNQFRISKEFWQWWKKWQR